MNSFDKHLLTILQSEFPLVPRPFASMAKSLGVAEKKVIDRIAALKKQGIIRQISAIFDSAKIGYTSTLAAFKVDGKRIEEVASRLSALPGVSHNYERRGIFNLWFTLTLPSNNNLKNEIATLAKNAGVKNWLYLPSIRQFKISFRLPMGKQSNASVMKPVVDKKGKCPAINKSFIQELQKDLPLVSRPFLPAAQSLSITDKKVTGLMQAYVDHKLARRFAAVLKQKKAGFPANVMVAWKPAENKKEILGNYAAGLASISHCYERPVSKEWPYSVYTMIHGRSMKECADVIADIKKNTGVNEYCALETVQEFKKQRVQYFVK